MTIEARQTNRRKSEEWYECARCGIPYNRSKVHVQNGIVLCRGEGTAKCQDVPGRTAFFREPLPKEQPIPSLPEEEIIL
jgi:hypothetical protein